VNARLVQRVQLPLLPLMVRGPVDLPMLESCFSSLIPRSNTGLAVGHWRVLHARFN
jgi:hypothetical protein